MPDGAAPVLDVRGLKTVFRTRGGEVHAVNSVSFHLNAGELLGVVGESGSGKTTLALAILRLIGSTGRISVLGQPIDGLTGAALRGHRRDMQIVFQDPLASLDPRMTIGASVAEPLLVHEPGLSRAEREAKVREILPRVGLDPNLINRDPHELSGGQNQRVGIARALVHDPEILLCDEATSALDPETTASILELLRDINQRLGLTIILITHEMAVIRDICHRVVVLERGRIVEQGAVWQVFGDPQHEVSKTLLAPLQPALPQRLQARLLAEAPDARATLVLRLRVSGRDREAPELSSLFGLLGGQVSLLQGGIEPIQERALGQLVVSVANSPHGHAQVIERARQWAAQVEVLGYVV